MALWTILVRVSRSGIQSSSNLSSQFQVVRFHPELWLSHLSKRTCDLKQNGTQEKAPFSGIVFCALALGVVCSIDSFIGLDQDL